MGRDISLTGKERILGTSQIIVSKTDVKGHITYANRDFLNIADYTEAEVMGQPHNIIRHPDMPRCVFKLLWDTLQGGDEIFAYVVNRCKNGDHYWVYAHVTPSRDDSGQIIGYHSTRRQPDRRIIDEDVIPLYKKLKEAEDRHKNRKEGLKISQGMVSAFLAERNMAYDEFVLTLGQQRRRGYR